MKKTCKKIANILSYVYGIGIMVVLFVGAISFVGYLVAFIIGGDVATEICRVIYKEIYPILFIFGSAFVFIGIIKMYLGGEVTFSIKKDKNKTNNTNESQSKKENGDVTHEEVKDNFTDKKEH